MNYKTWFLLLIVLSNISESKTILQCKNNEKICGDIYCIPKSYICCTNLNNSPYYCNQNQKCNIDGSCLDIIKMESNFLSYNVITDSNEREIFKRQNYTLFSIDDEEKEKDENAFFTSSYFDIIFVIMVGSILFMVIIVWFYGCGIRDKKNFKKRKNDFLYPSVDYTDYKTKRRRSKNKYDAYSDSFDTDSYDSIRHHHQRNKTASEIQRYHDHEYNAKKHRRHHSYGEYEQKLSDLLYQKYLNRLKNDHRFSRMLMKNNHSSCSHNHYNKKVEHTGSGDYSPPGYFEILWMTFSSVLDITTDIWYAESLFTNNVEIHYKNKWIFQVMSILTIAIPIILNMSLSFCLISRRLKASFDFLNWYRTANYAKRSTSFLVLFSAFNIELLSILVSGLWGLACFSAPIGIDDFWFRLKFWGFITTLVEDIPQFLIQFLILYPQIRTGKINALVVMKLIIAAVVLIVDCISKGLIWYAMGSAISPPKRDSNLPFDEQATLGFPTSYSYTNINDPTFESISSYSEYDKHKNHHKNHHKSRYSQSSPRYSPNSPITYSNNSLINYTETHNNYSAKIPKRKYYDEEMPYNGKKLNKKGSKYYHDLSYKNDSIIDIIDSDPSQQFMKKSSYDDKILNKFQKTYNSFTDDDYDETTTDIDSYLESSHSRSVFTDNSKDISESLSKTQKKNHHKISNPYGKIPDDNKSIMVTEGNNLPSLYSKNVKIRRSGSPLPAIKIEKSPSFIPPQTFGNMYDFNEVSSDLFNAKREFSVFNKKPINQIHESSSSSITNGFHLNNNDRNNNYRHNSIPVYPIKHNHKVAFEDITNSNSNYDEKINEYQNQLKKKYLPDRRNTKSYLKPSIKTGNNSNYNKHMYDKNKYYEESDISKEINKIQQKNRNEEEIIYIDNIRYKNMFKS